MTLASDNKFPKVIITEGAAPSSPSAGDQKLFIDSSDHLLKLKNSSGTVTSVGTGFANPMTTAGDIIYGGASGVATRLAGGTSGYVLTSNGATSAPSWQAATGGSFTSYATILTGLSGLVHRWKFEEASGNFADSVGSLTLTASGAFTYSVAGGPVSGGAGSVTFGASGKGTSSGLGSLPVANTARTFVLIAKGTNLSSTGTLFSYGTNSTRQGFLAYAFNTDVYEVSAFSDDLNLSGSACRVSAWHMIVAGYDGVQASYGFFDGQVGGHMTSATINTATGGNFCIGQEVWTGATQLGAYTYDDLAVFSRLLTPAEINLLWMSLTGQLA